jgi:(R,R)-butanediol dehydrogenase/meso-butanediol dehydrogenase/diacetyl reductase
MRAAEYRAPESLELVELPSPSPGPGQAVVQVAVCGICGSDLHSYQYGFAAQPGQVLGHEFAGRVLASDGVEGLADGARVCVRPLIPCGRCDRCLSGQPQVCEAGVANAIGYGAQGAFAERVLVPRAVVGETVFPISDALSDAGGAVVEPLAVALHAVRLAEPQPADTAVVFGLGTIGLGAIRFLRLSGVLRIVAFDPSPLRRERALELGADLAHDPQLSDPAESVARLTGPGPRGLGARADLVLECAGVPAAFGDALKVVRHGGRLVLAAMYSAKLKLNPSRIVEKELTLRGSFAYGDDFPRVIRLLESGALDPERLISHRFPLDRIDDAFRAQLDRDHALKVLVVP